MECELVSEILTLSDICTLFPIFILLDDQISVLYPINILLPIIIYPSWAKTNNFPFITQFSPILILLESFDKFSTTQPG